MEPTAERLALPDGYGEATTTLAWDAVRDRLEQAPRYWLVTTHPDGRAHVVPVDGLCLDDTWFYGGSPETLHHRNLERNPRAVVHLEDTWPR
jgi:pyridoxamine 5'-phosphate oxidase-like protein